MKQVVWPLMLRRVAGNSMLPAITPGRYVIGIRWWPRYVAGQIVIAEVKGREVIKRIDDIDGRYVRLAGDNKSESTDSRNYGALDRSALRARVLFVRGVR